MAPLPATEPATRATAATRRRSRWRRPGHTPIVFDLGTGVREYGDVVTTRQVAELEANVANSPYLASVLLTHLHWDHIIGLPFFTPAFRPDACIDVYGPAQPDAPLADVFADT